EMGSLSSEGRQKEWFKESAKSIKNKFPEIKAFVLFNSGLNKNIPVKTNLKYLDWRVFNPEIIFASGSLAKETINTSFLLKNTGSSSKSTVKAGVNMLEFARIKGVNYTKGLNWSTNYNTLRNKEIISDFAEIKQMGFNTVKRYGPDVYDYNLFAAAERYDLNINYGFFIPDNLDFLNDQESLEKLDNIILKAVAELKTEKKIIAWNFGNTPLQKFDDYYFKPELIYYQYAYAEWLKKLIRKIKQEDPGRPVSVDLEVTDRLPGIVSFLKYQVPEIDIFGLVINDRSPTTINYKQLGVSYFLSKIEAVTYLNRPLQNEGFFIADWQDQEKRDLVSFDGLKDNWGRNKISLYRLRNRFKNLSSPDLLPRVKILRPAVTIGANSRNTYHALVEDKNEWKLAESIQNGLKYDWYLVKTDPFGNGVSMKHVGSGASLLLRTPYQPWEYQLYLNGSRGNNATTTQSILNIPLGTPEDK
ncbi:MAG: cellulose synthase, partial [Pyrinomonadaceae bacterium]|nr:cellulose synthase [Sphingobacteriaceae bacterium]